MEVTIKCEAFLIKLPKNARSVTIKGKTYEVSPFYMSEKVILLYNERGRTLEYIDCDIAYITGETIWDTPAFKRIPASEINEDIVSGLSQEDKDYLRSRGYLRPAGTKVGRVPVSAIKEEVEFNV